MNLYEKSVDIILKNQHESGAYVACPTYPTYQYCWFRDGSYIAYAMDLAGHPESAARYHAWAAKVINRREAVVGKALKNAAAGLEMQREDILHTRYTLAGEEGSDKGWGDFQLDGFGTWLWALNEHRKAAGSLPEECVRAATLTAKYLEALWQHPCFDCWEEHPDKVHTYTLAAIYGGLAASQQIDGQDRSKTLKAIREYIQAHAIYADYFIKMTDFQTVDASLLGLATPYALVQPGDARMLATVKRIEASLYRGGGVHRYPTDTYYGGGEWVLLAGWLGWYYAQAGKRERANQLLAWIESQAAPDGSLPEQAPATLIDANFYQPWTERWGTIASPLLWSHAKYIILYKQVNG